MVETHRFYCAGCDIVTELGSSLDPRELTVRCPGCQTEMGFIPPDRWEALELPDPHTY